MQAETDPKHSVILPYKSFKRTTEERVQVLGSTGVFYNTPAKSKASL